MKFHLQRIRVQFPALRADYFSCGGWDSLFWPLQVPSLLHVTWTHTDTQTQIKPQQVGTSHDALLYGTPVGKADSTCPFSGHRGRQKTMIKCAICTGALKIALRSDKAFLCFGLGYKQIIWLCRNSMRAKRWSPLCWWPEIVLSQRNLKMCFGA